MKLLFKAMLITGLINPLLGVSQVVSAGADNETSQGLITWNIGQVVTELMENEQGSAAAPLTLQEIEIVTSVDKAEMGGIEVFPNPTIDFLHIKMESIITCQLTNSKGEIVYAGNTKLIDMTSMQSGTYFLTLNSNNTNLKNTYKVVKQ